MTDNLKKGAKSEFQLCQQNFLVRPRKLQKTAKNWLFFVFRV